MKTITLTKLECEVFKLVLNDEVLKIQSTVNNLKARQNKSPLENGKLHNEKTKLKIIENIINKLQSKQKLKFPCIDGRRHYWGDIGWFCKKCGMPRVEYEEHIEKGKEKNES